MISAVNFCKTIFIFSLQSEKRDTEQSKCKITKRHRNMDITKNQNTTWHGLSSFISQNQCLP
jgi:hypothetical protein